MRIALPKGRLLPDLLLYLERTAGLTFSFSDGRDYSPKASDKEIQAKTLKVRAIPQLLALGNFDVGFCGLDLLKESNYDNVVPLLDLGINKVTLVAAVARGSEHLLSFPPKRPLVIATEYERLATNWAVELGLSHIIIQTWGSTEAYVPEDADIVFDCIQTGRTMEANGLTIVDTLVESSTWMVMSERAVQRSRIMELRDRIQRENEEL